MDIKVRPVDKRTVRVNREVSDCGLRLSLQSTDGVERDVQHPVLWASNEEPVSDEICVYDAAPALVAPEREADTPEQLGNLWCLQVLNLDHVEAVLRPDFRG